MIDSQSAGIVGEHTASFDPAMSDTKYDFFSHDKSSSRILVNAFGMDFGLSFGFLHTGSEEFEYGWIQLPRHLEDLRRLLDDSVSHIMVNAFGMDHDFLRDFQFRILPTASSLRHPPRGVRRI